MKLATASSTITRGRLITTDTTTTDQVSAALDAATLHLGALLRTEFNRTERTDRYWIDSDEKPFSGEFLKMALNNGFVVSASPFSVRFAYFMGELAGADSLPAANMRVEYEKGLLLVVEQEPLVTTFAQRTLDKMFAEVTYTSGFTVDGTDATLYVGVPDWLKELAQLMALGIFRMNTDCSETEDACNCSGPEFKALLEKHIRWYPSAFWPLI